MIRKILPILQSVFNKYLKQYSETENKQEVNFAEWYRQSEDYKKINQTTIFHEVSKLYPNQSNNHNMYI